MPTIVFNEEKPQAERAPFEPLKPGKYNMEIVGTEFGRNDKGNEYMEVSLRDVDSSRRVWEKVYFTEKAIFKVRSLLSAVGVNTDAGTEFDLNPETATGALDGKTVGAEVTINEYEGKKYNRVARFFAPDAQPF